MHGDDVYRLTTRGRAELESAATTLTRREIEFLVRTDGQLPLAQVRAGMADVGDEAFAAVFRNLRDRRMIEEVAPDTFALQLQADLDTFTLATGGAEADAGMKSLQRSGYFVRIARKKPRTQAPAEGQMLSAVVVEDDANLARFIQSFLAFEGFQVRLAGSRADVLSEFRKHPVPDLVVLDVVLPDIDGFAILGSLRRHPALKDVPVIMLTGKATREAVLKGLAGGADGYITKPFEPEALIGAVRTVMGRDDGGLPKDPWANAD